MNKNQSQANHGRYAPLLVSAAIAAQIAFDLFALVHLNHQEQMNREQVKFDTTIAQKVFGYDATRRTNIIRTNQ